jgi:hypothetical protein
MMQKLLVGVAGLAMVAFAGSAMAADINPWTEEAQPDVNILVGSIAEVWSTLGNDQVRNSAPTPNLQITNAGGKILANGKYHDTLNHWANVNYTVSVALDAAGIPNETRLHVIVKPTNAATYNCVAPCLNFAGNVPVTASQVITWSRTGNAYQGGNSPGVETVITGINGAPTFSILSDAVDYAADAINALPPTGSQVTELIYTISG